MWILDSAFRRGVDLWGRDEHTGQIRCEHHEYDPPFLLRLPDPDAHHELIAALEERYRAEPCVFRTVFGEYDGYRVFAGRPVAEAIELQTRQEAELYNVDVRRDQRFMAEHGIVPCSTDPAQRYSPETAWDLRIMEIGIRGDPALTRSCTDADVTCDGRTEHLSGSERSVIGDLAGLLDSCDPDVILMAYADRWVPILQETARAAGLFMPFSRNGKYRTMDSRSYWSYGRVEHKDAALIPDGRVLIDTEQSFVYQEGGLAGVFMAARLSGLSANLAARFTPGTLISTYETYEAVRTGIAVPFRKGDAETVRKLSSLRAGDRGGMMFQPAPGIYGNVDEIDFTSMYPAIIVRENLSPETIGLKGTGPQGFLPAALDPLLSMRIATKARKKTDPSVAGIDAILKWMLVTCFGYTGYKNAKFGRIEVHEAITATSREILIRTKDIAEEMGYTVLHGNVDCLWVTGPPTRALKERVDRETRIGTEIEHFDWIVFLPLNDGFGSYSRYYGRLADGSVKVRGIAARRHDTPEYIRDMQGRMLEAMGRAATIAELENRWEEVRGMYTDAVVRLPAAPVESMAIGRRISRLDYAHRCLEGAAVAEYRRCGTEIAPGMKIRYVVRDARRYQVDPAWRAERFDLLYYRQLLDKAWTDIAYAFREGRGKPAGRGQKM